MKTVKQLFALASTICLLSFNSTAFASGQIDFADLSSHYGEPKVEVNLTADLMKMIGSFAKHEDPEVAEILSNLEFIKVRVYKLNGDLDKATSTVEEVGRDLRNDDWHTLVTVNDNEENQQVRILSKSTSGKIDGVVVMVVSPEENDGEGEAVFINIVGEIDPDKIAKVTDTFDIDIN